MRAHVKADEPFERSDVTVEQALELLPRRGPARTRSS